MSDTERVIVWFSCGAASAVAAKLAVDKYGDRCIIAYCDLLKNEHSDNARFLRDVETWLQRPVITIRSKKFKSVEAVFRKRRYMSGVKGAPCTTEMKKVPRFDFQEVDDIHVFGLTVEEGDRIANMEAANPELHFDWILRSNFITKQHCLDIVTQAGIRLPKMYELGFDHNNCIGCVKATSPTYWQQIRHHFPDVFKRRATQSRKYGVRLVRINGQRCFLDELPPEQDESWGQIELFSEDIECGPLCIQPVTEND